MVANGVNNEDPRNAAWYKGRNLVSNATTSQRVLRPRSDRYVLRPRETPRLRPYAASRRRQQSSSRRSSANSQQISRSQQSLTQNATSSSNNPSNAVWHPNTSASAPNMAAPPPPYNAAIEAQASIQSRHAMESAVKVERSSEISSWPKHLINARLELLLNSTKPKREEQERHAWNNDDKSHNVYVKSEDLLTFHRHPVAQSTDGIRSKIGYEKGMHLFQLTWPKRQRGTHAVVGVATHEAALHSDGYRSLVGCDKHSWGWDINRCLAIHDESSNNNNNNEEDNNASNVAKRAYPERQHTQRRPEVSDSFLMVLDMDEGMLGFVIDDCYLGSAFRGLRGKRLYVIVSAVWGHCEVSLNYLGSLDSQPLPLMHLCRRSIRLCLESKDASEMESRVQGLELPKVISAYLCYYKNNR